MKTAYYEKLAFKKYITLYHDTENKKWYFVSQYTGEIVPVSLKGFISLVKDF